MTSRRKTGNSSKRVSTARASKTRASAPAKKAAAKQVRPHVRPASQKRSPAPASSAKATRGSKSTAVSKAAAAEPKAITTSPGADCTIAHAANLHAELARVIDKTVPVSIDLAAVKRIDTAGLQVLAAFVRDRRAAGHAVECIGATDAFTNTAKLLGLEALFAGDRA